MDYPMSKCERQINLIIAKNQKLINSLDRNKNHLLKNYILTYLLITNKCV